VPDGYSLVVVITDNGFETSTQRFTPFYPADGSVSRSTVNPLSGASSLRVHVKAYGRVGLAQSYPYGGGPIADSVTVAAKVRVDSTSPSGRRLQVCSIAYFFNDSTPRSTCRNVGVGTTTLFLACRCRAGDWIGRSSSSRSPTPPPSSDLEVSGFDLHPTNWRSLTRQMDLRDDVSADGAARTLRRAT
jgi:hypothetical protein